MHSDKHTYMIKKANEAENAVRKGALKTLYKITKQLAGNLQSTTVVRVKEGKQLIGEYKQRKRWKEHFEAILN